MKLKLKTAVRVAEEFIPLIQPVCERVMVAGSVRRGKPEVADVDLVVIEKTEGLSNLTTVLKSLGDVKMNGPKIKRIDWGGVNFDIYVATPETWATLLLIRTGSMENNIRLCNRAKALGFHLHASGAGLFNSQGEQIAGETEGSIYMALGLPYQKPAERECRK